MPTAVSTSMPLNSRVLKCRYCLEKEIIRLIPATLYSEHLERCHPNAFQQWQDETRTVS